MPPVGVYSSRAEGRRFKETASPFRRNAIAVPAQRHRRFKAIEHPFRACRTGGKGAVARVTPGFYVISDYFMIDFIQKRKLTGNFPSAGDPFSCPGEFFLIGMRIPSVRNAARPDSPLPWGIV